jgi:molybdate-binding protein
MGLRRGNFVIIRLRKNLTEVNAIEKIHLFDQIKTLADARRMAVLRLLMAKAATLSQLGEETNHTPAWVRHHVQKLEAAGLVELAEIRKTGKVTEKFYQAKAKAFLLQEFVFPKSDKPVFIFSGSHDLAVELIAQSLMPHIDLLIYPVGSLDGLVNLRQGLCQISGAHLHDVSGEYNTPYVRHIFPDRDMALITLAFRTQGLIVAPGNPCGVRTIADLAQEGLRFINRNLGSGTRLWLDTELKRLGLSEDAIDGYRHTGTTHRETALAVAEGRADAALGLQAAAESFGLEFIPLYDERYDLVFPRDLAGQLDIFLNYVQSAAFRQQLAGLSGYQSAGSGAQVALSSHK